MFNSDNQCHKFTRSLSSRFFIAMANQASSALENYIDRTPDGTEIPDETFTRRHRGVLAFTAAFLPVIFALSRMQGVESVTGAELPAIPLLHSLVGTGLAAGILGIAALPQMPRRVRSVPSLGTSQRLPNNRPPR